VLSNETLVLLDVVSALGYGVVFCRLARLRAVGYVLVSDNRLVSELRECRVGSTESRLGFSHEDAIPVYCTSLSVHNWAVFTAGVLGVLVLGAREKVTRFCFRLGGDGPL
jgi:hypothetical protein